MLVLSSPGDVAGSHCDVAEWDGGRLVTSRMGKIQIYWMFVTVLHKFVDKHVMFEINQAVKL